MGELDFAVVPLPFVDDLSFYLPHAGVGLRLGGNSLHHAGYVQILDDQFLEFVYDRRGHLMLGVLSETDGSTVQSFNLTLSFPPAAASCGSSSLGSLPTA